MKGRSRFAALAVLSATAVLTIGVLAAPAGAEVIQGDCTGSAEFTNGVKVVESRPIEDVAFVPVADKVTYAGDTKLSPPPQDKPDSFVGGAAISLPWGAQTIVTWDGETLETKIDMGTYIYDVTGLVPQGTGPGLVAATHTQRGKTCSAVVAMALEGDPGWQAYTAAGLTLLAGVGVAGAGVRKKGVA